jgi:hypothetical protein
MQRSLMSIATALLIGAFAESQGQEQIELTVSASVPGTMMVPGRSLDLSEGKPYLVTLRTTGAKTCSVSPDGSSWTKVPTNSEALFSENNIVMGRKTIRRQNNKWFPRQGEERILRVRCSNSKNAVSDSISLVRK